MILVYMRDGNCVEVEAALGADRRNDLFVCFDADGYEIASFPFVEVESYTMSSHMTKLMEEEVCDELSLIPAEPPRGDNDPKY